MKVVVDLEANGLNPTKIWCIVAKDIDTNEVYTFPPESLHFFRKFSENISTWV